MAGRVTDHLRLQLHPDATETTPEPFAQEGFILGFESDRISSIDSHVSSMFFSTALSEGGLHGLALSIMLKASTCSNSERIWEQRSCQASNRSSSCSLIGEQPPKPCPAECTSLSEVGECCRSRAPRYRRAST